MEWLYWVVLAGVLVSAAIGFWVAWTVRGEALVQARADADYLRNLWGRTGGAQARTFALNAAARSGEPAATEDPAVRLGREVAVANLRR